MTTPLNAPGLRQSPWRRSSAPTSAAQRYALIGTLLAIAVVPSTGSARAPDEKLPRGHAAVAVPGDVSVSAIRGRAFVINPKGAFVSLRAGGPAAVDRPLAVGPKSRMDLSVGGDATLELGPGARIVLLPPDAGRNDRRVRAVRLDHGYLRVRSQDDSDKSPLEVSFGRWSARLQPGDYVFDTKEQESTVCTVSGSLRMSAVPEGTPAPVPGGCVRLTAQAPSTVGLNPADWGRVESRRALLPVVAEASRRQSREAMARLEARYAAAPARPRPSDNLDSPVPDAPSVEPETSAAPAPVSVVREAPPARLQTLPRTRMVALAVPRPLPHGPLEAMARRVDRDIARAQARLAAVPPVAQRDDRAVAEPAVPVDVPAAAAPAAGDGSRLLSSTAPVSAAPAPVVVDHGVDQGVDPVANPLPPAASPPLSPPPVATREVATAPVHAEVLAVAPSHVERDAAVPPSSPVAARPVEAPVASAAPPSGATAVLLSDALLANDAPVQRTPPLEWIVNVATFPSLESAERQVEQLRLQNVAPGIRRETVRGRSSYRVVIEGLASEHAANTVLQMLISHLGLRQAWVLRKH